jgi:hypothetical protein
MRHFVQDTEFDMNMHAKIKCVSMHVFFVINFLKI